MDAQTPGLNYQALILKTERLQVPGTDIQENQVPLLNTDVTLLFKVENGAGVEYIEEHQVTTDENGMVSLIVGEGTPTNGTFSGIVWDGQPKYLNVEIDIPENNEGFVLIDIQKILYIPQPAASSNLVFENGLTKNSVTIELGGPLVKPTQIETTASNTLAITGLGTGNTASSDIVVINKATGVLQSVAASSLFQEEVVLVIAASDGQTTFNTPLPITDSKKVNVYRNGVRIDFTTLNTTTIEVESEATCYQNDEVRIVQFN